MQHVQLVAIKCAPRHGQSYVSAYSRLTRPSMGGVRCNSQGMGGGRCLFSSYKNQFLLSCSVLNISVARSSSPPFLSGCHLSCRSLKIFRRSFDGVLARICLSCCTMPDAEFRSRFGGAGVGVLGLCSGVFGLARVGDSRFRAPVGGTPEAVKRRSLSREGALLSLQSPASSPESRKLFAWSLLGEEDAVVDLLEDPWDMLEAFSASPLAFSQAMRLLGVSEPARAGPCRKSVGSALEGLVARVLEGGLRGACVALTGRCIGLGGLRIRGRGGFFSFSRECRGGSSGLSSLPICGCVCDVFETDDPAVLPSLPVSESSSKCGVLEAAPFHQSPPSAALQCVSGGGPFRVLLERTTPVLPRNFFPIRLRTDFGHKRQQARQYKAAHLMNLGIFQHSQAAAKQPKRTATATRQGSKIST